MKKVIVNRESNGIVWVEINREERRNAVDYDVMDQLSVAIDEVSENSHDKVFVLTGSGDKAFCSGGDLSEFRSLYSRKDAYHMLSKMGEILYKLMTLNKPTVALLNGSAVGGGCELATACDFRLASSSVKYGFVQGKLAITTGWGGSTILMERLPIDRAFEMLTKAKVYTAEQGVQMGFIQEIFNDRDLKGQCREWVLEMLEHSTGVLSAYKECAVLKWEQANVRARMFKEIAECSKLWEQQEHHDAVEKFLNG